jgi:hypothetical protein
MLVSRPLQATLAGVERETLHFSWPIPLSASDLPMIPVALGVILGLCVLLRGGLLLRRGSGDSSDKTAILADIINAATIFPTESKEPQLSTTLEVIRLSPDAAPPDTNTQQGRIAAALRRVGVSPPTSWTADRSPATVDLADEQTMNRPAAGNLMQSLDFNASKVLKRSNTAPHPFGDGSSVQPFQWKPAAMVWGGPILTLACLYILALHFGWMG